jgi:hypothetical protein
MADSSLVPFDAKIANNVTFKVLGRANIRFQFVPRIVSDSNSSLWLEKELWAIEPLRVHKGSSGRRITMNWEYIATDNVFTPDTIWNILNRLKSYFYDFKRDVYPVVQIKYPVLIPIETNFRLRDINITHGDEIVGNDNGDPCPLHTKVSASLELATAGALGGGSGGPPIYKVDVPPVNRPVDVRWY